MAETVAAKGATPCCLASSAAAVAVSARVQAILSDCSGASGRPLRAHPLSPRMMTFSSVRLRLADMLTGAASDG